MNKEQLSLYYGIGRYVSENSCKGFLGKGAIEQRSYMLQQELPGLRGLMYMFLYIVKLGKIEAQVQNCQMCK